MANKSATNNVCWCVNNKWNMRSLMFLRFCLCLHVFVCVCVYSTLEWFIHCAHSGTFEAYAQLDSFLYLWISTVCLNKWHSIHFCHRESLWIWYLLRFESQVYWKVLPFLSLHSKSNKTIAECAVHISGERIVVWMIPSMHFHTYCIYQAQFFLHSLQSRSRDAFFNLLTEKFP